MTSKPQKYSYCLLSCDLKWCIELLLKKITLLASAFYEAKIRNYWPNSI